MISRILLRVLLVCSLFVGFEAMGSETTKKSKKRASQTIVDPEEFSARLPDTVYIEPTSNPEGKAEMAAAIEALGLAKKDIPTLPEEAILPKPGRQWAPKYPHGLRQSGTEGYASFVVLIGADGKTKALFCYQRTHPLFERNAADALEGWRYSPARVKDVKVATIRIQKLTFSLAEDAGLPSGPVPMPIQRQIAVP